MGCAESGPRPRRPETSSVVESGSAVKATSMTDAKTSIDLISDAPPSWHAATGPGDGPVVVGWAVGRGGEDGVGAGRRRVRRRPLADPGRQVVRPPQRLGA